MNNMKLKTLLSVAVIAALSLAGGCEKHMNEDGRQFGDRFPSEDISTNPVGQFTTAQTAKAACEDANLFPQHFDGNNLNSLGQDKLALMLKADSNGPLTIYIEPSKKDGANEARHKAVVAFLKDHGLPERQFKVESGYNIGSSTMARESIQRYGKTESGEMGGGSGAADTSSSMPAATGGK
jgi:hypothetical protein